MELGVGAWGLSLAAGGLSTLSPCVLPLVPILIGSAATAHRAGPLALAGGLALSFAVAGTAIASLGAAFGLDGTLLRNAAATLLIAFGVVLVSATLQQRFAERASRMAGAGNALLARLSPDGLSGQFALGLVLGLVWSPCVGPTLGGAITLASQGQSLGQVAWIMALFGIGAGLPLIALGFLSREAMLRWRGRLISAGKAGKQALGAVMLLLGAAILTGADKRFEAWVLDQAPAWLVTLTTSL